MTTTMMTILTT